MEQKSDRFQTQIWSKYERSLVDFAQISFRFVFKIFQISAQNLIQICASCLRHHHLKIYRVTSELCRKCTSDLNGNLQDFFQIWIKFLFQIWQISVPNLNQIWIFVKNIHEIKKRLGFPENRTTVWIFLIIFHKFSIQINVLLYLSMKNIFMIFQSNMWSQNFRTVLRILHWFFR